MLALQNITFAWLMLSLNPMTFHRNQTIPDRVSLSLQTTKRRIVLQIEEKEANKLEDGDI